MTTALDRTDRDAARWSLAANAVVVAGAGTGKTTLLTDRILFSLLGPEKPRAMTEIVALTFTEKAAGEIRLRLCDRLLGLAAFLSGAVVGEKDQRKAEKTLLILKEEFKRKEAEILPRVRAALEDMDKAQIGTIHSFAAHLLRLYPLQAGVDPNFSVDEGAAFDELFAGEWVRWLDEELSLESPRSEQWLSLLRWVTLEDVEDLARGLARERVRLDVAGCPDLSVVHWLEGLARSLRKAPEGQPTPRGKILEALAALASHLEGLAKAAAAPEPSISRPQSPPWPDASWPSNWDKTAQTDYERAKRIAKSASAPGEALVRRAFQLTAPFADSLQRTYARSGWVSFDGLLVKARDLVRDHPSVREELKSRYGVFLIDEFQDTDPLQGELLLFLSEEPGAQARHWNEVKPGAGRLFLVGDPKQSIYRFRGADIAAYQGFTDHLLQDKKTILCELTTNFRSTSEILGPINAIFPSLMQFKSGSQPAYLAVAAHQGSGKVAGSTVEYALVGPETDGGVEPDAATGQKTESAWVSEWIRKNCGDTHSRRFKEVAVLMRTSSSLAPLLEAFKSAGIPYVVEMEKLFYASQEVIDFVNLLRVLDDPEDRVSFIGLLRSPLLGVTDAELLAGFKTYLQAPPKDLSASTQKRLEKLFKQLRSLHERRGRVPLGEFVQSVLSETPFLSAASTAYHGQQTVSNLQKFARMACAAGEERGSTLREFIHEVIAAMEESRAEGESPLADEHLDAVRILSIHKAKGLEFPVVFVVNLSGATLRNDKEEAVLLDWSSGRSGLRLGKHAQALRAMLEARERERQEDEAVRVLYVALTRAKEKLFLVGRRKNASGSLAALLDKAHAWPKADDQAVSLGSDVLTVHQIQAGSGVVPGALLGRGLLKPRHRLPVPKVLADSWTDRLKRRDEALTRKWTRSPTDYLREPAKGWALEEKRDMPKEGMLIGQLCHRVLAIWDFVQGGDLNSAVEMAGQSLSAGESARREAEKILQGFVASAAAKELGGVEILGREVPFVFGEDGTVVRGVMDLVYRQGDRVIVADYKTEAGDVHRLEEKYRRQGQDYCAAIQRAWGIQAEFRLIGVRH